MDESKLYPKLSPEAEVEAQKLIDRFKSKMTEVATETIENLYCDVANYIESDSWHNFRSEIMEGFRNYNNSKISAKYDFKRIREEIFHQFKDEIIKDLNADLYEENLVLREQIKTMNNQLYNRGRNIEGYIY